MTKTVEPRTKRRAFGRQLSDLWLDGEEGELHPAESRLLDSVILGNECILVGERPETQREECTIRAEFLRFLALGGDSEHPVHERGVMVSGAYVICRNGALELNATTLPSNFHLRNSKVSGVVQLRDASAQTVSFSGTHIDGLRGDRLQLTGSLFLRDGFVSKTAVRLHGSQINGSLHCEGGVFEDPEESLNCFHARVERSIFLNAGFLAKSKVGLFGVKVGGDVSLRDGKFLDRDRAVNIENGEISGKLLMSNGFLAKGEVFLQSISVGAGLACMGGTFSSKSKSIHAPRAKISGNVNLGKDCRIAGEISFQGAKLVGDLTFQGGSFETKGSINLRNATIEGMLVWRDVAHTRGELNLSGTSCRTLNMDWKSWEKPSQIRLDNFTYLGFSELPEGCNAPFWINWLERQPERHLERRFRPKPYKQLATVLSDMGHEEEARSVRIAQRKRQADFTRKYDPELNRDKRWIKRALLVFWNFVQRIVVAYGYRPGNALLYLAGLILIGSVIYHAAARDGIMTPTHPLIFKEAPDGFIPERCAENWVYLPKAIAGKCAAAIPSEYSEFNAIVYSLDTAIPVVDFRMESDWAPRVVTTEGNRYWPGWWVRTWEWFQIGAGWALSLLFVSAIGGVIRRE